jgi:hypothetical protein
MMTTPEDSRQTTSCPSYASLIEMLQSEPYAGFVSEYRDILEEDPDYLVYHHTSAALKLQFLLKDEDFPSLCIGDCIDERLGECCVVTALREAIKRTTFSTNGNR